VAGYPYADRKYTVRRVHVPVRSVVGSGWRVVVVLNEAQQGDAERRPDPPEDADGAADLHRAVGKQLKLLRERAGWTQKELGDRLGYGEDLISALERGRRTPQPELLDAADDLLGAGGLLKATKEDVARAKARTRVRHPAWFRDYARLEAGCQPPDHGR
jgi:DNA-binding XRE family transcriptional regulator